MDTSDWIGLGGIAIGVASAIAFGCGFAHFHDKLKTPEGRADVAADLRGHDLATGYINLLSSALAGLRTVTGTPFSIKSIGFCFFLAMTYAFLLALGGWGSGGSGGLGSFGMFSRPGWVPTAIGNDWLAFSSGVLLAGLGIMVFVVVRLGKRRTAMLAGCREESHRNFVGLGVVVLTSAVAVSVATAGATALIAAVAGWLAGATALAVAVAVAGVAALSGSGAGTLAVGLAVTVTGGVTVAIIGAHAGELPLAGAVAAGVATSLAGTAAATVSVAGAGAVAAAAGLAVALIFGINNATLIVLIFWTVLPLINTASDYLSLGISHRLGRWIVDDQGHSFVNATLYGLLDLVLALGFMVIAAATIPMALALLQWATAFDLGVRAFVTEAAADPWGAGLWFGIMILSTLFWTSAHLLITLGAVLFRLYDAFPIDRWVADVIEAGKDRLWVKLYLSSKWLVVFLIWCVLVYVFFWLLDGATHVISTLFGSDKGIIGVLEMVALWGMDLVPLPREFRALPAN